MMPMTGFGLGVLVVATVVILAGAVYSVYRQNWLALAGWCTALLLAWVFWRGMIGS